MMHFGEILLPLNDNSGRPFRTEKYAGVREHLTERFGGLTAFSRSPAQGTTSDGGKTVHDEIIVFEVMAETLDASWWRGYRLQLEREFRQDGSWSGRRASPCSDGDLQRRTSTSFSKILQNRRSAGDFGCARRSATRHTMPPQRGRRVSRPLACFAAGSRRARYDKQGASRYILDRPRSSFASRTPGSRDN
jgi:hypothetical protein